MVSNKPLLLAGDSFFCPHSLATGLKLPFLAVMLPIRSKRSSFPGGRGAASGWGLNGGDMWGWSWRSRRNSLTESDNSENTVGFIFQSERTVDVMYVLMKI